MRAMRFLPTRAGVMAVIVAAASLLVHAQAQGFTVVFVGGKVRGDDTLKVRQGDDVDVRFTSDRPMVLHLHGYELEAKATPAQPGRLAFKASLPGRFPIHVHGQGADNHRAALFIEVHP
jgi:hypothetical protein